MLPTVREVLDVPAVRGAAPSVLSGADSLDRPVRWVHVSEVRQVEGLLQGGELLLSTGLAMQGDPQEAARYVEDLVAADACGIVVELSDRFPELPATVLAVARRAGFPVVTLHRQARFVLITEEVHRMIVADQFAALRFTQEVHETFTTLSLQGARAAEIVTAAAEIIGTSVVLEDLSRRVVAYRAMDEASDVLLADWTRRSRLHLARPTTDVGGPEGWTTTPVGGESRNWGRLVVPRPTMPADRLAMVLERAAQALELSRMIERDLSGLLMQAHAGFLGDALAGRVDDEADARARAEALGLPRAGRYVPVVVTSAAPSSPQAVDAVTAQRRTRRLVERVTEALGTVRLDGLSGGLTGGSVGMLLALPGRESEDAVLTRLSQALADAPSAERVVLGVGAVATTVLGAALGLRGAVHVAEVARAMPERAFHRHADIRLHGLIAQLDDDPRVQSFAEAELAPVLLHDAARGDDLLGLLRQYLAVGGNKAELARTAHRSRPALYKRLDRLEQVLGVDLDEPASRLSLGVALLAHDRG